MTVMPSMPSACRASLTASSRWVLTIASILFISPRSSMRPDLSGRELGHGKRILGVSEEAELGHVQALHLDLGRDAHGFHLVDDREHRVGRAEGPGRTHGRSHELAE